MVDLVELDENGDCALHLGQETAAAQLILAFGPASTSACTEGYDASAFTGLEVVAKGQGTVWIEVTVLDSTQGLVQFLVDLALTESWKTHLIPWTKLAAGNPDATFDPAKLVSLRVGAQDPGHIDFWLSEASFLQQQTSTSKELPSTGALAGDTGFP
jgi:hypothetical protein